MPSHQLPQAKTYRPFLTSPTTISITGRNEDHTSLIPEAVLPE